VADLPFPTTGDRLIDLMPGGWPAHDRKFSWATERGSTMKWKLCAAILAASGVWLSPANSAPLPCSNYATVAAWAAAGSCVDNIDGDLLVTFVSSTTFPLNAAFNVTEVEIGGVDLYNIGFNWDTPWAGGGSIKYNLTSLNNEVLIGANFDTIVQGAGALATKNMFDVGAAAPYLTLTSANGARDPAQGETPFASRASVDVVDTFNQSGTAVFFHADNSYKIAVTTTAVPTLSEWGMYMLMVLLAMASLYHFRNRE
jgi:hypothetical protein